MDKPTKIFIPEIQLFRTMSLIIQAIREDYNESSDKKDTFLYNTFQDHQVDNYEFFEQLVEIFTRTGEDTRELKVRLFFDAKRAELPTIHINLPSEQPGEDGMGTDEGFQPAIFDDPKLEFVKQFNRRFNANYQVIFTSNNSLEVIALYHVVRAAVIANLGGLEVLGFTNLSLSGGDLQIHPDIIPTTVFARGFNLKFGYDVTVPAIQKEKFYKKIFSRAKLIIKEE